MRPWTCCLSGLVAGVPTDELLDTRRRFWGASIEAEAITPEFGASLYTVGRPPTAKSTAAP